jgi:perosamine synthetase
MPISNLALFGGEPFAKQPFPAPNTIGEEEKAAVMDVLYSGILSDFRGAAGENFLGGKKVRALEEAWAESVGTKYAITVNSLTRSDGMATARAADAIKRIASFKTEAL